MVHPEAFHEFHKHVIIYYMYIDTWMDHINIHIFLMFFRYLYKLYRTSQRCQQRFESFPPEAGAAEVWLQLEPRKL